MKMEQENQTIDRELTYQERQEIKALSKMFLGSSSRWQKLERKGTLTPKKDADGNPIIVGYNKKVKTPVKVKNEAGEEVTVMKPSPMYLYETVRANPLELLAQLRDAKAKVDAAREAQRQAQEANKAAAMASGSAEGST
jgi:hypothetical protein